MRPSRRKSVNKHKSASQFRANVSRTKAANVWSGGDGAFKPGTMRGGIRL